MITEPKVLNALWWILDIFEKHNVPYQIAGGTAARLYGATRPINDIDMDIPRTKFDEIFEDVKQYITYGPEHFVGEKWDIYEMVLNYGGQEIDLAAAETCKVFNDERQEWVDCSTDLGLADTVLLEGREVRVCPRQALIEYKKHLSDKEHQRQDVAEIS